MSKPQNSCLVLFRACLLDVIITFFRLGTVTPHLLKLKAGAKKSADLMTELLIKVFCKEGRIHAGAVFTCTSREVSVWGEERHTHMRLNREIFVHSARMSDEVKMQEKRVNSWKPRFCTLALNMANFFPECLSWFHKQVYICSERVAQVPCILMSVKYGPTHANRVGASTKANTVGCAACLQTFPAEQEWQSGGLPTVLTAEKRGREDPKPGRET